MRKQHHSPQRMLHYLRMNCANHKYLKVKLFLITNPRRISDFEQAREKGSLLNCGVLIL